MIIHIYFIYREGQKMVYCTAFFKAKDGREDELFNALQGLEKETRAEKGCIQYKVMKCIENACSEGEFGKEYNILFNEIWETEEDFNIHNASKHVGDFFQKECLDGNGSAESWNVNLFE